VAGEGAGIKASATGSRRETAKSGVSSGECPEARRGDRREIPRCARNDGFFVAWTSLGQRVRSLGKALAYKPALREAEENRKRKEGGKGDT
jgi:hypothetical protein